MSAKSINREAIKLSREKQNLPLCNHLPPFTIPFTLVNKAHIHSSTLRLGTGGPFSSSSMHHFGNRYTKMATKGTIGEGSRG